LLRQLAFQASLGELTPQTEVIAERLELRDGLGQL
jgi:hypothetical protein